MNYWTILGIKPTDDKAEIKKAFAEKSKLVHPEEHPEEFRQLHDAYKQALKDAGTRIRFAAAAENNLQPQPAQKIQQDELSCEAGSKELQGDSGEEEYEELPSEADEESEDPSEIFRILDEAENKQIQGLEALIKEFLIKADTLAKSKDADSYKAWRNLFYDAKYSSALMTEPFIEIMTLFTQDHSQLKNAYYGVLAEFYSLGDLEDRTDKGPFAELFVILKNRKKMPAMVRFKRVSIPVIAGLYTYVSLAACSAVLGLPILALVSFIIPLTCFAAVLLKEKKLKKGQRAVEDDNPENDAYYMFAPKEGSGESEAENDEENSPEKPADKSSHGSGKGFSPVTHIKKLQRYSAGVIMTAFAIMLGGIYMVLAFDGTWALLSSITMAVLAAAGVVIMIITNLVVRINALIKKEKSCRVKNTALFIASLLAVIILVWLMLSSANS